MLTIGIYIALGRVQTRNNVGIKTKVQIRILIRLTTISLYRQWVDRFFMKANSVSLYKPLDM